MTIQSKKEICQSCGCETDTANGGYFVDTDDIGPDAQGGTAELFRTDTEEQLGDEWIGFENEDIGVWCNNCSWKLQQNRSA